MTFRNKSKCCIYSLFLALAIMTSGAVSAQTAPRVASAACDSVKAFNLKWEFKKPPTDSLLQVLVGMVDATTGDLPAFASFWKSELRARILDPKAERCPRIEIPDLHLPKTTFVFLAFGRIGFEIKWQVYRGKVLERGTKMMYFWDKKDAPSSWSEEVLDFKAHTYTKRNNGVWGKPESMTISTEAGKITSITVLDGDQPKDLHYSLVNGQEHFVLYDLYGKNPRELNPKDPKDLEVWKAEGEKLYRRAFTSYFRMPASMSEFSSAYEATIRYKDPFAE